MTPVSQSSPVAPGGTIGILGGGQLGRMLALAAARLGLHTHIYCPNENAPACEVAKYQTIKGFDDRGGLREFAQSCDVVTYEFENIPLETADEVAAVAPLYPGRKALEVSQDRAIEKAFLCELGIRVAPWWSVDNQGDLGKAITACETPALLKTRRLGYDGKGQINIDSGKLNLPAVTRMIQNTPAILEKKITFECEVSVILVRGDKGDTSCYDLPLNQHESGILKRSTVPSGLPPKLEREAIAQATKIAEALDYRGVLAVEFFVTGSGEDAELIVNEFAPRVHNTGHWTLDACQCSQFENHIRAIAGWPLGSTGRHSNAQMTNLLGEEVSQWQELSGIPGDALHLYGKQGVEPGRKLGHLTSISSKQD